MIESLYYTIIQKIILPIADRVMKTSISKYIKKINKMHEFSIENIEKWQNKQLRKLILHAYNNTQYYKELFDESNIKVSDIQTISDLNKIPILTKHDIINNFDKLIPSNINSIPHKKSSTGGSTGDPLSYLLDKRSWSFSNANSIINWGKTGYRYGEKYIALGSTSLFVDKKPSLKHQLYYKLKNKIGLNGVNMSDKVCRSYIELMKENNIKYVYGYASAIYLLAKWAIENNEVVNIKSCFTTSEILTSEYRKIIFDAFQCKIVDCYGAHDGGITAFSFEEGCFEVSYNSLVRFENSDNKNYGPALITDLFNYSMPLINYKLGDELFIDNIKNEQYSYNGQIINKVIGRSSDILQLSNGHVITGPGFTILFKDIPVEYYCIEKTVSGSIICWIIKLLEFNIDHERNIFETLKKQVGDGINIEVKYIDEPFLSKSGKRKYMIDNSSFKTK